MPRRLFFLLLSTSAADRNFNVSPRAQFPKALPLARAFAVSAHVRCHRPHMVGASHSCGLHPVPTHKSPLRGQRVTAVPLSQCRQYKQSKEWQEVFLGQVVCQRCIKAAPHYRDLSWEFKPLCSFNPRLPKSFTKVTLPHSTKRLLHPGEILISASGRDIPMQTSHPA